MNDYVLIPRDIFSKHDWCKKRPALQVFIYLLLEANTKSKRFGDEIIERGSIATKNRVIAEACGLTVQNVRDALSLLVKEKQIKRKRRYRDQIITITDYESYKDDI